MALVATALATGCNRPVAYGRENTIRLAVSPGSGPRIWAMAPTTNVSGQPGVDPLLQSDLCYQQLQAIEGLTVVPVDRVAAVYASLGIERVQSPEQAALVCDLLNADALLVPTVTAFEPYTPPKMGASLTLFIKPGAYARPNDTDPRALVRQAAPEPGAGIPPTGQPGGSGVAQGVVQSVGMFDAANGTVRESLRRYAYGRQDPVGPYGEKELLVSSDKYSTFVWRRLTEQLLDQLYVRQGTPSGAEGKTGILEGGPAGPQPFPSNRR